MMRRHVALLRAINVAGHARLGSAELAAAFAAAGALDVRCFGHAGNVLFRPARDTAAAVAKRVGEYFTGTRGERPAILLRRDAEIIRLVAANPFADCGAQRTDKLYVAFLLRRPRRTPTTPIDLPTEGLSALACLGREVLLVSRRKPNGFYGFPNAFVETVFGVCATTRNWSTITKLAALLKTS